MRVYGHLHSEKPDWNYFRPDTLKRVRAQGDLSALESSLRFFIRRGFEMDNLTVLAGLGTSMYYNLNSRDKVAPDMDGLWKYCKAHQGDALELACEVTGVNNSNVGNVETLLERLDLQLRAAPNEIQQQAYRSLTRAMAEACDFLDPRDELFAHKKLLEYMCIDRMQAGKSKANVVTTNYDLCFEHAADQARVALIDGFSHGPIPRYDHRLFDFELKHKDPNSGSWTRSIRLIKLHGSIDWEVGGSGIVRTWSKAESPIMLFPDSQKVAAALTTAPFERLNRFFSDELRKFRSVLWIIGFGFRDQHISTALRTAIQDGAIHSIGIIDSNMEAILKTEIGGLLKEKIDQGNREHLLFEMKFEDFVEMLPSERL